MNDKCVWVKNVMGPEEDSGGNRYCYTYIYTQCDNDLIEVETKKEGAHCPFCGRSIVYAAELPDELE